MEIRKMFKYIINFNKEFFENICINNKNSDISFTFWLIEANFVAKTIRNRTEKHVISFNWYSATNFIVTSRFIQQLILCEFINILWGEILINYMNFEVMFSQFNLHTELRYNVRNAAFSENFYIHYNASPPKVWRRSDQYRRRNAIGDARRHYPPFSLKLHNGPTTSVALPNEKRKRTFVYTKTSVRAKKRYVNEHRNYLEK